MACETHEKQLNSYFDRELDAAGRETLMEHLRGCSSCRWDFKLYRKMFQTMERMEVEPPADLAARVMESVRKLTFLSFPGAGRLRFLTSPAAYGLAAAAVFMVAVIAGQYTRPAPHPYRPAVASVISSEPRDAATDAPLRLASSGPIRVMAEGEVEVLRKGSLDWTAVRPGERIGYEDRIRTSATGSARLEYPDRAFLKIKPRSLVQVLDEAVRVFQGDAWIKVQKKGSRFEARTPNAVASVRGTIYAVQVSRLEVDRSEILRIAEEGAAQATLGNATSPSGSNASLSAAGTPLNLAEYMRQSLLQGFRTDVLVFESEVAVSPLDTRTGEPTGEVLVRAGHGTSVVGTELAEVEKLAPRHFLAWQLPPPPGVLDADRPLPSASAAVAAEAPGSTVRQPSAFGQPTGEPVQDAVDLSTSARPRPGSVGYDDLRSN